MLSKNYLAYPPQSKVLYIQVFTGIVIVLHDLVSMFSKQCDLQFHFMAVSFFLFFLTVHTLRGLFH